MERRQPPNERDPRRPPPNDDYNHQGHYQQHGPPSNYRDQPVYAYQHQQPQYNIPQQQWDRQYPQQPHPQHAPAPPRSAFSSAKNPSFDRPQRSSGPGTPPNFSANEPHHQQYQQRPPQAYGPPPPRRSAFHPPPPRQQQQQQWNDYSPEQQQLPHQQQRQWRNYSPDQQWPHEHEEDRHEQNYSPIEQYVPPADPRVVKWVTAAAATTAELPARYATRDASPQMPLMQQATAGNRQQEMPEMQSAGAFAAPAEAALSNRDARCDAPQTQMRPSTSGGRMPETPVTKQSAASNATVRCDARRKVPLPQTPPTTEGRRMPDMPVTKQPPVAAVVAAAAPPQCDARRDAPHTQMPAVALQSTPGAPVDMSDYPTSQFKMAFEMYQKRGHNLKEDWGKELIHRSHIRITDETAVASNDKNSLPQHHHFVAFCKYNPVHVMDSLEITHHEEICPDKKVIELLMAL